MSHDPIKVQLPLATLIEFLEFEGFKIGIDIRLKLQQILHSFKDELIHEDGLQNSNLSEIRYYIRPLIAKSRDDEAHFDSAFDKYLRHIDIESRALEEKLNAPEPNWIEKAEKQLKRHRMPTMYVLGTIIFLALAYYMNIRRDPPEINLSVNKKWLSLNDTVTINGQLSGIFAKASISIDSTEWAQQNYFFPQNDNIQYIYKFEKSGEHEVTLKARNRFTSRDTIQKAVLSVCESKPKVDFEYKVNNPLKPLEVTFIADISNATSNSTISMTYNGAKIGVDKDTLLLGKPFVHVFEAANSYVVELSVKNKNTNANDICNQTIIRKSIDLKSVILGERKNLTKVKDPDTISSNKSAVYLNLNDDILDINFSTNGEQIITVTKNAWDIWDFKSKKKIFGNSSFEEEYNEAIFSPDGEKIMVVSGDSGECGYLGYTN